MRVVMDDGARSSIDVHSMEESIQMASVANMCTKFGYVNRGLDTEDKKASSVLGEPSLFHTVHRGGSGWG